MKVNVLLDKDDNPRTGYVNVFQNQLDTLVDDAEADEIIASGIIDYVDLPSVPETIEGFVHKLAHNGTITLGFFDLYYIAHAICDRTINTIDANGYLYGLNNRKRQSAVSMDYISKLLSNLGLKILSKRIVDGSAIIKARRP